MVGDPFDDRETLDFGPIWLCQKGGREMAKVRHEIVSKILMTRKSGHVIIVLSKTGRSDKTLF